jgi:hypothetical protein
MTQVTLPPQKRFENLNKFMRDMNSNADVKVDMEKWRMQFESEPIKVVGRQLPCEKILMRGDQDAAGASFVQQSGDFGKEIRGKAMRECVPVLSKWVLIVSKRDEGCIPDFGQT